jgi:hypothetical protein
MRPSGPDWNQLSAELDRVSEEFAAGWPEIEATFAAMDRRRVEIERLAEKRRRRLERRETVAFWTGIGGNVLPWLTAAVTAIVAGIGWL